jgi:pimeloyl-ACP methyl ester carboxylesterase
LVDADGVCTRYDDVGDSTAEPLLLCHGAGWSRTSSTNTWCRNPERTGELLHVFAADKLASGLTGNLATPDAYSIQHRSPTCGRSCAPAASRSRVPPAWPITGGYPAARIALGHPDQTRSLIVVDSAPVVPDDGSYAQRRRQLLGNAWQWP